MKKIFLIGGFTTIIDTCMTLECPLFRYGVCHDNIRYALCYDLETWNSFNDKEKIINKRYGKGNKAKEQY